MLRSSWPAQNKQDTFMCLCYCCYCCHSLMVVWGVDFLNILLRKREKNQEIVWVGKCGGSRKTCGKEKEYHQSSFCEKFLN